MRWLAAAGAALALSGTAAAQSSASYLAGVGDRTAYEAWFASLSGDFKTGVEFWANHRSIPKQATCFASGMAPASEWMHGCLTAQQRFAPWDAKRKSDPEYRLGWNSIQSPEVQQAIASRNSADAAPPTHLAPALEPQFASHSSKPSDDAAPPASRPDLMTQCRDISSENRRLQCFDWAARVNSTNQSSAPTEPAPFQLPPHAPIAPEPLYPALSQKCDAPPYGSTMERYESFVAAYGKILDAEAMIKNTCKMQLAANHEIDAISHQPIPILDVDRSCAIRMTADGQGYCRLREQRFYDQLKSIWPSMRSVDRDWVISHPIGHYEGMFIISSRLLKEAIDQENQEIERRGIPHFQP